MREKTGLLSHKMRTACIVIELLVSIACILYLLERIFDNEAQNSMVMLFCAVALAFCLTSGAWQLQSWRVKKSDMERDSLLLAMGTIYPMQVLVNLDDDSYDYLPETSFINYEVPRTGVYSRLVESGLDMVFPDDRGQYELFLSKEHLISAFSGNETALRIEYRDKGADGQYHWIVMHVYKLKETYDNKLRAILFARVNDNEKMNEELLRESLEIKKR